MEENKSQRAEEGLRFEEVLARFEQIVHRLEEGNLSLDESLNLFEQGVKLSKICSQRLNEAQRRIEVLTKDEDGDLVPKPFLPEEFSEEDR